MDVPLEVLADWSPFLSHTWIGLDTPVTVEEVQAAVREGRLQKPISVDYYSKPPDRRYHIERIAYLVVHGWDDPISLDVGVPSFNCYVAWIVDDGNHRHAAAIVRGDTHIKAFVGGEESYAVELLGIDPDALREENDRIGHNLP